MSLEVAFMMLNEASRAFVIVLISIGTIHPRTAFLTLSIFILIILLEKGLGI